MTYEQAEAVLVQLAAMAARMDAQGVLLVRLESAVLACFFCLVVVVFAVWARRS